MVRGTRVRLAGIDAPELRQHCRDGRGREYACGAAAKAALERRLAGGSVACLIASRDRYRRALAICAALGPDAVPWELNTWLVERGWASVYGRHARRYRQAEARARAGRYGIWANPSAYEAPESWRKRQGRKRA
ncbi:hypothetical protein QBZ16_003530 [Prototheca wickerhamii]|uniref:TNase-like domain-containing protein n=1 Tax=Prototheca wickerhamii TaxID=3111 RepID=A0AAD9MKU3_PROWI|nr:hypothetical protein QBZ16_003530 [Prototheca wickerhamii]